MVSNCIETKVSMQTCGYFYNSLFFSFGIGGETFAKVEGDDFEFTVNICDIDLIGAVHDYFGRELSRSMNGDRGKSKILRQLYLLGQCLNNTNSDDLVDLRHDYNIPIVVDQSEFKHNFLLF